MFHSRLSLTENLNEDMALKDSKVIMNREVISSLNTDIIKTARTAALHGGETVALQYQSFSSVSLHSPLPPPFSVFRSRMPNTKYALGIIRAKAGREGRGDERIAETLNVPIPPFSSPILPLGLFAGGRGCVNDVDGAWVEIR